MPQADDWNVSRLLILATKRCVSKTRTTEIIWRCKKFVEAKCDNNYSNTEKIDVL